MAATELKKNGKFKLGGVLNMKLKKKPAKAARKGVNPFTKSLVSSRQASQQDCARVAKEEVPRDGLLKMAPAMKAMKESEAPLV